MTRPLPLADADTAPFWEAARRHELALQRCERCARFVFPPKPGCPQCHGTLAWTALSGRGRIHSFCITRMPLVQGFEPPYVVAMVEIEEQPGCHLNANIVDCPVESVAIGMAVRVAFEERAPGVVIPQFRPA